MNTGNAGNPRVTPGMASGSWERLLYRPYFDKGLLLFIDTWIKHRGWSLHAARSQSPVPCGMVGESRLLLCHSMRLLHPRDTLGCLRLVASHSSLGRRLPPNSGTWCRRGHRSRTPDHPSQPRPRRLKQINFDPILIVLLGYTILLSPFLSMPLSLYVSLCVCFLFRLVSRFSSHYLSGKTFIKTEDKFSNKLILQHSSTDTASRFSRFVKGGKVWPRGQLMGASCVHSSLLGSYLSQVFSGALSSNPPIAYRYPSTTVTPAPALQNHYY